MIPELIEQGIPPQSIAGQLASELRAAPQIRELLLRELFTEEFLALPQRVERLEASVNELRYELLGRIDEAESRLNGRIDARVDEAESRLNNRIDEAEGRLNNRIDEAEGRLNNRIDETKNEINARIDETKIELGNRMNSMESSIKTLQGQVDNLRGQSYEDECRRRIRLVILDHLRGASLADLSRIDEHLEQARHNGRITRQEFDQVRVIDIIAQGTPADGQSEILAVVEASVSLNEQDVRNAARRAALIRNLLGEDTAAFCVSHYRWSDSLAGVAAALGVTLIHYELPGFDIPEGTA